MTKVLCADMSCEYCNDKGVCTLKEIRLSWNSVATVNNGRQEYNKCRDYSESEDSKRVRKVMAKYPFPGDRSF